MITREGSCMFPDCQIRTELGGKACEHSCPLEAHMKRPKPHWRDCAAKEIPGGSCQFPQCGC
jgi:hypothetical protein